MNRIVTRWDLLILIMAVVILISFLGLEVTLVWSDLGRRMDQCGLGVNNE